MEDGENIQIDGVDSRIWGVENEDELNKKYRNIGVWHSFF
jgi:hypothetical protein